MVADADAVFPRNPFDFYKQEPGLDLELCSDAPYLANNYENEPMMVMAGYFYARGGARTARFLEEVIAYQAKHPAIHDQQVFNAVLATPKRASEVLKVRILSPYECANGMNYFSARAIQASAAQPFVIQNNWATGAITKRYRFREHGLWELDTAEYLGHDGGGRYLVYDNVQWPLPGAVREKAALRAAMALGKMLGRIVILPLFCQFHASVEASEGVLDRWCTMDELFDLDHFTRGFGDQARRNALLPKVLGLSTLPSAQLIRASFAPCLGISTQQLPL